MNRYYKKESSVKAVQIPFDVVLQDGTKINCSDYILSDGRIMSCEQFKIDYALTYIESIKRKIQPYRFLSQHTSPNHVDFNIPQNTTTCINETAIQWFQPTLFDQEGAK
jgi:hypothetical protein